MSAPSSTLRKAMTMRYAVALYMSSVLGSGVLVLPSLAAQIAAPASLVAWGCVVTHQLPACLHVR